MPAVLGIEIRLPALNQTGRSAAIMAEVYDMGVPVANLGQRSIRQPLPEGAGLFIPERLSQGICPRPYRWKRLAIFAS